MIAGLQFYQQSTINYQLLLSRLGQELLPNAKLGVFRKESFRGEHSSRSQVAGRDRLFVFNVLARINQDAGWSFLDRMVLGPFGQHDIGGIEQLHFDSLVRGKLEVDHAIALIADGHLDFQLSDLRKSDRLGRHLKIQNETAQFWVLVFRQNIG